MNADETSADTPMPTASIVNAGDEVTMQIPRVDQSAAPVEHPTSDATDWDTLFADDSDDEWQTRIPPKTLQLKTPTAILIALLVAAGAFWGGAAAQRSEGTSGGGGAFATAAARLRAAGITGATATSKTGTAGGFGGLFGGRAAAAAAGTVTEVIGSTLYITSTSGSIVKVVLSPTATITRTATTKPSGLTLGDTVSIEGSTAKDGTVTATSVTATASGVTTTRGFGG